MAMRLSLAFYARVSMVLPILCAILCTIWCAFPASSKQHRAIVTLDRTPKPLLRIDCMAVPVNAVVGRRRMPGIFLTKVSRAGAAYRAGLRAGDVVFFFNNRAALDPRRMDIYLRQLQPSILEVKYARKKDGMLKPNRTKLRLGAYKNPFRTNVKFSTPKRQTERVPVARLESYMYRLVTRDREQNGLKGELQISSGLAKMARDHADDMVRRDYRGHTSPEGRGVLERARLAGLNIKGMIYENCAYPWPDSYKEMVEAAQASLMNSPEHEVNILRPDAVCMGIGIAYRQDGGIKVVQVFSSDMIP